MVSIPYRKVRNTAGKLDIERLQVSIPYRKVRNLLLCSTAAQHQVSIPYRKVRNGNKDSGNKNTILVSIPYRKVRNCQHLLQLLCREF